MGDSKKWIVELYAANQPEHLRVYRKPPLKTRLWRRVIKLFAGACCNRNTKKKEWYL